MISESALDDLINIAEENARKYGFDSLAKNCQASRTELAAMRARIAELEAQPATLTPRQCNRACFERGWQAAIEAAAFCVDEYAIDMLAIDGDELDRVIDRDAMISKSISALQPPAECGDCNPLKPQSDEVDSDELDEVLAQLNPVVSDYIRETSEHDAVAVDVCGMCKNFNRCESLFGCKPGDTECDWYPSRFERA